MELLELEEMKAAAELWVSEGYDGPEAMAQGLLERFELNNSPENRMIAWSLLSDAMREHERAQASWPEETDCDLLDQAFERLEERGIVARQNFTCCNTCGCHEIQSEVACARADSRGVRGYVFFHAQATEEAARSGDLMLNYGPAESYADKTSFEKIGREVVETLREVGLRATWSGKAEEKIRVEMSWQRRRVLPRLAQPS